MRTANVARSRTAPGSLFLCEPFLHEYREDLRPDISQWHTFNTRTSKRLLEDHRGSRGRGGTLVYSATGEGHTAFIDTGSPEFAASSLEEFVTRGSRW
jgi:hypothetical protein